MCSEGDQQPKQLSGNQPTYGARCRQPSQTAGSKAVLGFLLYMGFFSMGSFYMSFFSMGVFSIWVSSLYGCLLFVFLPYGFLLYMGFFSI